MGWMEAPCLSLPGLAGPLKLSFMGLWQASSFPGVLSRLEPTSLGWWPQASRPHVTLSARPDHVMLDKPAGLCALLPHWNSKHQPGELTPSPCQDHPRLILLLNLHLQVGHCYSFGCDKTLTNSNSGRKGSIWLLGYSSSAREAKTWPWKQELKKDGGEIPLTGLFARDCSPSILNIA